MKASTHKIVEIDSVKNLKNCFNLRELTSRLCRLSDDAVRNRLTGLIVIAVRVDTTQQACKNEFTTNFHLFSSDLGSNVGSVSFA